MDPKASSKSKAASKKKATRSKRDGFPEIPHFRGEIPGKPGSFLRRILVEERGLRDSRINEYHDPRIGLADAMMASGAPYNVYRSLDRHAREILKEAGEQTPDEVLEAIPDWKARPIAGLDIDAGTLALAQWVKSIYDRKGRLSIEATAADFLAFSDRVSMLTKGDEKLTMAITDMCEAWYWLAAEVTGVHSLAVAGIKATRGRNTAAPISSLKKMKREAIVRDEYQSFAQEEVRLTYRTNATYAAGRIEAAVNERLQAAKLGSYKLEPLRKLVGSIIKEIRNRNAPPNVPKRPERTA